MGIFDLWLDFRDRCLTSEKFHRFALSFPLTRPIVQKRQAELFDIVSGFVNSQVLFSCVELGLLDEPAKFDAPGLSIEAIASHTGLGRDEALRLAQAAAALRIFQERGRHYRLGDLGAALSVNKGALAMIRHHKHLYKDLCEPVELLRSGRRDTNLSAYWDYARSLDPASAKPEEIAEYSELMSKSQDAVSAEVIACFDFGPFHKLLDVGGGQGTFLSHVGWAHPHLKLDLFDLPRVAERAKSLQQKGVVSERIRFHGGSFLEDDLPAGPDLVSLVRIVHDHDDEIVEKILSAVHKALQSGGTILIAEPMASGGQAHRISDVYFNFYLYAMGSGRPRSPSEIMSMLTSVGFRNPRLRKTRSPFTASIVTAQK